MSRLRSVSLVGGILAAGVGLVLYGELRPLPPGTFTGKVADLLPLADEVPGWDVREEPIADTPETKEAVNELLNYTDAAFVSYSRGAERISIYVAYWEPGRMSSRLIASHTPDVCWVGAGWERLEAKMAQRLTGPEGINIAEAELRRMRQRTSEEWVLFWHFSGKERVSYGAAAPPWSAILTDLARGFDQRGEQFFVRISTPHATERLAGASPLQAFLVKAAAARLPLAQTP
jgi:hypothetical protein